MYLVGTGVEGDNDSTPDGIFENSKEGRVEGYTIWCANSAGLPDGRLVNCDSDGATEEELDCMSNLDSKLDGTKEGKSDGRSDLGHVGEQEGATVSKTEGLVESVS